MPFANFDRQDAACVVFYSRRFLSHEGKRGLKCCQLEWSRQTPPRRPLVCGAVVLCDEKYPPDGSPSGGHFWCSGSNLRPRASPLVFPADMPSFDTGRPGLYFAVRGVCGFRGMYVGRAGGGVRGPFRSARPVWGATFAHLIILVHLCIFQSTRPVWGAMFMPSLSSSAVKFQSTHPVGGATWLLRCPAA